METFSLHSLKHLNKHLTSLVKTKLWAKVVFGLIAGILLGFLLSQDFEILSESTKLQIGEWLTIPGKLFLRTVQMIVIPLVFASIVRGIAGGDNISQLKSLGLKLSTYFVFTTTIALTIGSLVALIIKPGSLLNTDEILSQGHISPVTPEQVAVKSSEKIGVSDQIINLLPQNPLSAMSEGDLLQVVIFAIIFGFALIVMESKKADPILELLASIQEVCMTVVKWAMYLAPFAVFGMLANTIISTGVDTLIGLAAYIGTVIIGLILMIVFYLLLILLTRKISPLSFLKKIVSVQLLAFSTSSSAAVMPLSIKVAEDDLEVDSSIAQFTIPLGSTINMDGTALYQIIATIFLAQAYQIDLTFAQLLLIGVSAVGASIGAPGTPGVGIVILGTILQSVGIPLSGIALILAVDRILDMSRTVVNVTGDLTASIVMNKLLGKDEKQRASTERPQP